MKQCFYEGRRETKINRKRRGASDESVISVSTYNEHTDHELVATFRNHR